MPEFCWASDLHLDRATAADRREFLANLRRGAPAPLVLTGDTGTAATLIEYLEAIAAMVPAVYYVLGNHDHYGGSVAGVRDAAVELADRNPRIQWLPPAGVIALDARTALIGVDGWADGRHGDPLRTPLVMNDDRLIAEIAAQAGRRGRLAVKRALADADAERLDVLLQRAAVVATTIVVATHIPPFADALPATGHLAGAEWLPLLVCGATGAVLREFAATHPDRQIIVLCGHIHAADDVPIAGNLRCVVAAAKYGEPRSTIFQIYPD